LPSPRFSSVDPEVCSYCNATAVAVEVEIVNFTQTMCAALSKNGAGLWQANLQVCSSIKQISTKTASPGAGLVR